MLYIIKVYPVVTELYSEVFYLEKIGSSKDFRVSKSTLTVALCIFHSIHNVASHSNFVSYLHSLS